MSVQSDFHGLAVDLGALFDQGAISMADGAYILARFIQEQLGCSQVTFWVLDSAGSTRALRRLAGFAAVAGSRMTGATLLPDAECGAYFDVLFRDGAYVSDDCLADERLTAMKDSYLLPNDIRASMDVTMAFNGAVRGLICCAQQGAVRHWSRQELALLKRCAAEISLRRARRRLRDGAAISLTDRTLRPGLSA